MQQWIIFVISYIIQFYDMVKVLNGNIFSSVLFLLPFDYMDIWPMTNIVSETHNKLVNSKFINGSAIV